MEMNAASDLKWLKNADHCGECVRFSDTELAEPESMWMMKSNTSPEVRFYATGKGQVGPSHKHLAAATVWAIANRWVSPDVPIGFALACRSEVLAGGCDEIHRLDEMSA